MRLGLLCEKQPCRLIQLGQPHQQLLQGVAHLPALLMQFAGITTGAVFIAKLLQGTPVFVGRRPAMGEQQRSLEARQIEQQLITDPAAGSCRVTYPAILDGHFQALGIAVAANRQLWAGQAQQRPCRTHKRTPN